MNPPRNLTAVLATFGIGLTAGIAPFLFMQLLPAMLSREATLAFPNHWAMLLTGGLIGAITTIVFAGKFDQTESREIFFYALGVPAVLIATTTNITTQVGADRRVADVRERASAAVLAPTPDVNAVDQEPKRLTADPTSAATEGVMRVLPSRWGSSWGRTDQPRPDTSYLVVIGDYTTADRAREAYRALLGRTLRTERYVQKSLEVYELRNDSYIIAYSRHPDEAAAQRTAQLLRINDPDLQVRLLKYGGARSSDSRS